MKNLVAVLFMLFCAAFGAPAILADEPGATATAVAKKTDEKKAPPKAAPLNAPRRVIQAELRNARDNSVFPLWREHQELKMVLREKDVISDDDLKRLSGASTDSKGETRKKWRAFAQEHGLTGKAPEKTEGDKPKVESDAPTTPPAPEPGKAAPTPPPAGPSADSAQYRIQPVPGGNVTNALWDGGPVRVMLAGAVSKGETPEAPTTEGDETKTEEAKTASDIKVLCRRGEEVIPGVTVVLYNSEHTEIVRGTSGPKEGRVTFKEIPNGDYYVRVESFPQGYFPAEVTQAAGGKDAANELAFEFKTAGDLAQPPSVTVPEDAMRSIAKEAADAAAASTAIKDVRVTADTDPGVYGIAIGLGIVALLVAFAKRTTKVVTGGG